MRAGGLVEESSALGEVRLGRRLDEVGSCLG